MRRKSWKVGKAGIRATAPGPSPFSDCPVRSKDHCFYCGHRKGEEHKEGCVIRERTVVIRASFDLVVEVPEDWTEDKVEFKYNGSSWCADNLISDLVKLEKRVENGAGCLCHAFKAEFLREATSEDERNQQLFAELLPS